MRGPDEGEGTEEQREAGKQDRSPVSGRGVRGQSGTWILAAGGD